MKATERVLKRFKAFSKMYCDGTSYRKIASEFNTYYSTLSQYVIPALREAGKLTPEMDAIRAANKAGALQITYLNNRLKKRSNLLELWERVKSSSNYEKIRLAWLLTSTNPESEWKILIEELRKVDDEFFGKFTHKRVLDFKREVSIPSDETCAYRLLIDRCGIRSIEEFRKLYGAYTLNNVQLNALGDFLYTLTEEEQIVIHRIYYDGKNLRETSSEIGGCIERCRLIRNRSLSKLKDAVLSKKLECMESY